MSQAMKRLLDLHAEQAATCRKFEGSESAIKIRKDVVQKFSTKIYGEFTVEYAVKKLRPVNIWLSYTQKNLIVSRTLCAWALSC